VNELSRDPLEASIAAYDEWEPQLRAFAWLDRDRVRHAPRNRSRGGALDGLPVGVKDIFDTAGIPTEYGSPIFAGRVPNTSAIAVTRLEAAGAVTFGKTVTAELAYLAPGPTTNPWDPSRTPGGSSMGSAAAVAAGIVPVALGTQTNGSLIRPAAFCGVVGFKPSAGRIPTTGVLSFSPSLDQVGVYARDVVEAARVGAVLAEEPPSAWLEPPPEQPPVLGVVRSPEWEEASSPMHASFDAALRAARAAGATLRELTMGPELAPAIALHRTIMDVEGNGTVKPLVAGQLDRVSAQLRELFDRGEAAGRAAYAAALDARPRVIDEFERWAADVDALVTLPVLGEAPPIATTGDPRCCTRWTLVGAPAFSLPNGKGSAGLPLAIQLVGHRGEDRRLTAAAQWLEPLLAPIGDPRKPSGKISHTLST
jgi:Asp-tRNA(Asn)/Glu-tRNA(Gln) amidotransferase A subunit family amidase